MRKIMILLVAVVLMSLNGLCAAYANPFESLMALAEEGDAEAQLYIGVMYHEGKGGASQDYKEAVKWFLSADQGFADAQHGLGDMYDKGQGVPQDFIQAHMWFNLAAAQGDEAAQNLREEVAKKMIPEQISEAQRLAREWKGR